MELLTQVIAQLSVPAQLWTPTGEVVASNSRFNELLGLDPQTDWTLEGRRFVDDPQLGVAGARELAQRALTGAAVEIAALPYTPAHIGSEGPPESLRLFIRLRPIWQSEGELGYILCTVTEYAMVSERLEHDLMRSQKMENVETLASSVAHEFNNIFTGIRGLSELIRDASPEGSEIAEFATLIGRNILRGADLIDKLSSFAREMPHSLRRIKMTDYLKRVMSLLELQTPKRMTLELRSETDGYVLLDPSRMDQALANLVSNAKDATGGSGTIRLILRNGLPSTATEGTLESLSIK